MGGTKPLDYLLLSPDKKIDYRVNNGISIKDWYESFRSEPVKDDRLQIKQIARLLGVNRNKVSKLREEGFLVNLLDQIFLSLL